MDVSRRNGVTAISGIVALTALVYAAAVRFGFVYDDVPFILQNPRLTTWSAVPSYFTHHLWVHVSTSGVYYRPLFLLWFRINYALFGISSATPWHCTTILLHLLATVLVFYVLRRTLSNQTAVVVGTLVFALHPGHVESVAWICGCTDPLLACALLASLLCWFHRNEARGTSWLVASLALFLVALLIKETAIILPALIFLYAFTETTAPVVSRAKTALLAVVPFVTMAAVEFYVRHRMLPGGAPGEVHSLSEALATTPSAVVFYVRHLVWPLGLSPFYGLFLSQSLSFTAVVITLIVAVILVLLALRSRECLIAVCWLVLPLLPALAGLRVFDRTDVVHDRYLYFSCIGLGMLIGIGVSRLRSGNAKVLGFPAAPFAVTAALVLAMVAGTATELKPWLNNLTLFVRGVEISPQSPPAYNHLAFEMYKRGDVAASERLYKQAIALDPDDWGANFGLAVLDMRVGNLGEADQHFERAIGLQPQATSATYLLQAQVRLQSGRATEAEQSVRRAIQIWPGNVSQHSLLGQILIAEQKPAEAKTEFERELELDPNSAAAQAGLAQLTN